MKFDKLKVYLIEFVLLFILAFAFFKLNANNRIMLSIILLITCAIVCLVLKKRKVGSINYKKVNLLMVFFAVIYLIAFYLMGIYFGYYDSPNKFCLDTLTDFIIPTAIIIVSSEIIRGVLLAQNTKYNSIITCILMILIDLIIYVDIYNTNTYQEIIDVIGFIFFASVACNLLYNYIGNRYGVTGNIIYRLITILYIYFIPVIPEVMIFFRSVLRLVYPYIIYQVLEYTFVNDKKIESKDDLNKGIVIKIILGIFIGLLAMLISCRFKYGILVIASGSMSGTLNKGSAIIFEQYDTEKDIIKKGDIIVFKSENLRVVHRVDNVSKINGKIQYITKGDANQERDEGYITDEDVLGIYKMKIDYIGYPSLWIRDVFTK